MFPIVLRKREGSLESIGKGEWSTSTTWNCHYPPRVTLSASWRDLGGQVERKAVDSNKVEMVAGHGGHIQS